MIGTVVRRQLLRAIAIAALVNVSFVSSVFSADAQSPTPTLLAQLRDGGLIIYFRHSLTTRTGQPDDDLSGCANQRNLNDAGRQLARDIGQAFALLKIPVGKVQSSPYCRCRDTASLAFGRTEVAAFLETNGDPGSAAEQGRLAELARALQVAPPPGSNTVFVAHGNNLRGLAQRHGYPDLFIDEAEAVIFRPRAGTTAEVVARVKARDWKNLAGQR
ncbi:MAG TPA: hypothetical protein VI565_02915 [Burkholderiales bacterium]|nr:hypothetical protein [Burkholderiales bacterium]